MITRRTFLSSGLLLPAAGLMGLQANTARAASPAWHMPDEGELHARTWMAFGPSTDIWGKKLLPGVRDSLATVANTIVRYEPVSMLVRQEDLKLAQAMMDEQVELIVCPIDDLWMRDTAPLFVVDGKGNKAATKFNFNGWGQKQEHARDAKVADFVAAQAKVKLINTKLVLEGGCIEVDGHGTAIATESCLLNDNRNPGFSKAQFEDELMPLLGLKKIIWLPGIKGKDITDGHTDFYARFASPGVVLAGLDPDPDSYDHEITKHHLEILQAATDAQGKKLEIMTLQGPDTIRPDYETKEFAAGYVGFYVCNGAVIMQEFGDKAADDAARATVKKAFPNRKVVQINTDGIAAGGGSIHCSTQQEPA